MNTPQLIYYLDDDIDDLYIFKDVAESLGHEVSIFVNGNELLKALKGKQLPDIIFLDIRMPVFNGEEILHLIKKTENSMHIPVVMISASHNLQGLLKLPSAPNDFIAKPFDIDNLIRIVKAQLVA